MSIVISLIPILNTLPPKQKICSDKVCLHLQTFRAGNYGWSYWNERLVYVRTVVLSSQQSRRHLPRILRQG